MIQKFEDFIKESRFVDPIDKKFTGEKRKEDIIDVNELSCLEFFDYLKDNYEPTSPEHEISYNKFFHNIYCPLANGYLVTGKCYNHIGQISISGEFLNQYPDFANYLNTKFKSKRENPRKPNGLRLFSSLDKKKVNNQVYLDIINAIIEYGKRKEYNFTVGIQKKKR